MAIQAAIREAPEAVVMADHQEATLDLAAAMEDHLRKVDMEAKAEVMVRLLVWAQAKATVTLHTEALVVTGVLMIAAKVTAAEVARVAQVAVMEVLHKATTAVHPVDTVQDHHKVVTVLHPAATALLRAEAAMVAAAVPVQLVQVHPEQIMVDRVATEIPIVTAQWAMAHPEV